jgi:cytochrome c biogenesis protein CcmG/thiol:disulfide interchange protein DsbE
MTLADERPPRSRRVVVLLPLIIFLALAVLFFIRLFAGDPARLPSALIGRPVPEFSLPALQGLVRDGVAVPGLAAADLKGDKVTVVNVWASWCAPCRVEHPLLAGLAADPRVRLVGINYKDNAENARRFLGALGNPFAAVGVDTSGRSAIDWGVYGVPETFVVSRDGVIRHKHVGPLSEEAVKTTLADAIAKAAK